MYNCKRLENWILWKRFISLYKLVFDKLLIACDNKLPRFSCNSVFPHTSESGSKMPFSNCHLVFLSLPSKQRNRFWISTPFIDARRHGYSPTLHELQQRNLDKHCQHLWWEKKKAGSKSGNYDRSYNKHTIRVLLKPRCGKPYCGSAKYHANSRCWAQDRESNRHTTRLKPQVSNCANHWRKSQSNAKLL